MKDLGFWPRSYLSYSKQMFSCPQNLHFRPLCIFLAFAPGPGQSEADSPIPSVLKPHFQISTSFYLQRWLSSVTKSLKESAQVAMAARTVVLVS